MYPKFVWVGEHKYRLIFKRLDDNDRGQCLTDKSEIIIDTHNASKTQILETIFHEISHALSEHFDLQPEDPTDKNYEHIISCCGKAIILLMIQNKSLFRHVLSEVGNLTKEEKKCSKKKKRTNNKKKGKNKQQ